MKAAWVSVHGKLNEAKSKYQEVQMYHEEKIVDGVLHWRHSPDGDWVPYSIEELSHRLVQEQAVRIARAQAECTAKEGENTPADRCPSCGDLTAQGRQRLREKARAKPIFYRDPAEFNKPVSMLLDEIADKVANLRGKLSDIVKAYGWEDRIDPVEGAMTCVIISLSHLRTEIGAHEQEMSRTRGKPKT